MADNENKVKVPVSVLTGFLGAGKTTLLNYILNQNHGKRIAVIENEFGEVGIDDALVNMNINTNEEIFEMNNGCICCTVRGDLIRILARLAKRKDKFDYVLIETTGLADPAPVAQTFFVDDDISGDYYLDGIVTVVDSKFLLAHLDDTKPEGVENEAVEQLAFADRILTNKTDLVSADELTHLKKRIQSINGVAPIHDMQHGKIDLDLILNVRAFDLKKVLEVEPNFLQDQEHQHDQTVSSVGIEVKDKSLSLEKLNTWLRGLLRDKGTDIFRSKGVLNVTGQDKAFVFQGVHMLLDAKPGQDWGTTVRTNKIVFIGRNLNREELTASFMACF